MRIPHIHGEYSASYYADTLNVWPSCSASRAVYDLSRLTMDELIEQLKKNHPSLGEQFEQCSLGEYRDVTGFQANNLLVDCGTHVKYACDWRFNSSKLSAEAFNEYTKSPLQMQALARNLENDKKFWDTVLEECSEHFIPIKDADIKNVLPFLEQYQACLIGDKLLSYNFLL